MLSVIARSEAGEAIHLSPCGEMDCFASLAMTGQSYGRRIAAPVVARLWPN